MTMETNARLARIVYRGLLRWAYMHDNCPVHIQRTHINRLVPELTSNGTVVESSGSLPDDSCNKGGNPPAGSQGFHVEQEDASVTVRYLATLGFRKGRGITQYDEAFERVNRAIDALRLLNTRYHDSIEHMKALREEHAKIISSNKVRYSVGQVFVHKKYGYKGIIYGFDSSCQRDDEWMSQMQITDRYQPFYYVLPDEEDARKLLGGVRLTKYVAEENIEIITSKSTRIVHRALENYFVGYSNSFQRYVPTKRLQFEYPDTDYATMVHDMEDLHPSDSNVIALQDDS